MAHAPAWGFSLPPTAQWVLALGCRTDRRAPTDVLSDAEWVALRSVSSPHRLDGLLVHAVASGALPASERQLAEIGQLELDLTSDRMWQEHRVIEVVELLRRAGIDTIVLKGLALATLDYPDAQMRPTGDVDLLVRGEDLAGAGRAIEQAGGVRIDPDPVQGFAATVGKGAAYRTAEGEIDLHRLLVWGPFGVRLDPAPLWTSARRFEVNGVPLLALGLEESLLHACAHLLIRSWRRAITARDVAQFLEHPALDTERVLGLARRWGSEAVLAAAVLLVRRELALESDGPLVSWAHGYPSTIRDRLWLRVDQPDQPLHGLEELATYLELPTAQSRALLRRATIAPAPGTWEPVAYRAKRLVNRWRRP